MSLNVNLNAMIPLTGETSLHLAASRGHLHTVKWLVEGLYTSDEELQSYDSAVQQRYFQTWTADLLIDPLWNNRPWSGETEAKRSARESVSELQALCGRHADINMRTREGRSALHLAASNGHVPIVHFLIQIGADMNLHDNQRKTALQLTAENGHLDAVKVLLTAGADLDVRQLGATLKRITKNGHDAVANLLAWHFFNLEITGKPSQWAVLALATESKQNTVRDAIRKINFEDRSIARRVRDRGLSQHRKM